MTRRVPTIKPTGIHAGIPGCWVAWVEDGGSRDERRRRLGEVPEKFRGDVKRQVRVAFAVGGRGSA